MASPSENSLLDDVQRKNFFKFSRLLLGQECLPFYLRRAFTTRWDARYHSKCGDDAGCGATWEEMTAEKRGSLCWFGDKDTLADRQKVDGSVKIFDVKKGKHELTKDLRGCLEPGMLVYVTPNDRKTGEWFRILNDPTWSSNKGKGWITFNNKPSDPDTFRGNDNSECDMYQQRIPGEKLGNIAQIMRKPYERHVTSGDIKTWDISLLTFMLSNSAHQLVTKDQRDVINRVRHLRNTSYGHARNCQMSDEQFKKAKEVMTESVRAFFCDDAQMVSDWKALCQKIAAPVFEDVRKLWSRDLHSLAEELGKNIADNWENVVKRLENIENIENDLKDNIAAVHNTARKTEKGVEGLQDFEVLKAKRRILKAKHRLEKADLERKQARQILAQCSQSPRQLSQSPCHSFLVERVNGYQSDGSEGYASSTSSMSTVTFDKEKLGKLIKVTYYCGEDLRKEEYFKKHVKKIEEIVNGAMESHSFALQHMIYDQQSHVDDADCEDSNDLECGFCERPLKFSAAKTRDSYDWVPDANVSQCKICKVSFSLLVRKHHCRSCGNIFCNDCSSQKQYFSSSESKEDGEKAKGGRYRVCNDCAKRQDRQECGICRSMFCSECCNSRRYIRIPKKYREKKHIRGKQVLACETCAEGDCSAQIKVTFSDLLSEEERRDLKAHIKKVRKRLASELGIPECVKFIKYAQGEIRGSFVVSIFMDPVSALVFLGMGLHNYKRLIDLQIQTICSSAIVQAISLNQEEEKVKSALKFHAIDLSPIRKLANADFRSKCIENRLKRLENRLRILKNHYPYELRCKVTNVDEALLKRTFQTAFCEVFDGDQAHDFISRPPKIQKDIVSMDVSIPDLITLNQLRDRILFGELDSALSKELQGECDDPAITVLFDKTHFAQLYQQAVMIFDKLTKHQDKKLRKCQGNVHLKGHAGTGKTFVALRRMLEVLDGNYTAHVLFVCKNLPLALYIARWVSARRWKEQRTDFSRLHFLVNSESCLVPQGITVEKDTSKMILNSLSEPVETYDFVAVDEAHHVYGGTSPGCIKFCEQVNVYVGNATSVMFLSDESQKRAAGEVAFPDVKNMHDVVLEEIVRSTQRLTAAALVFQLKMNVTETKCHEGASAGPFVKSFLFDLDSPRSKVEQYKAKVMDAVKFVQEKFPGLSLGGQLAIVLPDAGEVANHLPKVLQNRTGQSFPYKLVDAEEALATLKNESYDALPIVIDSVSNMDGLECLVVIAVDLDNGEVSKMNISRSQVYRALTRAQLMGVIINHNVDGGWFQFMHGRNHCLKSITKIPETGDFLFGESCPKRSIESYMEWKKAREAVKEIRERKKKERERKRMEREMEEREKKILSDAAVVLQCWWRNRMGEGGREIEVSKSEIRDHKEVGFGMNWKTDATDPRTNIGDRDSDKDKEDDEGENEEEDEEKKRKERERRRAELLREREKEKIEKTVFDTSACYSYRKSLDPRSHQNTDNNPYNDDKEVQSEIKKLESLVATSKDMESIFDPDQCLKQSFGFDEKISKHNECFCEGTRKWAFNRFSEYLEDIESRILVIEGAAGVGKSAIMAQLCIRHKDIVAARHFFAFDDHRTRNPLRMLKSLAWQLINYFPAYGDILKAVPELSKDVENVENVKTLFNLLFAERLARLETPFEQPIVFIFDALDECESADLRNDMVTIIADHFIYLPRWIKIVVSTRPNTNIMQKLHRFSPMIFTAKSEENISDVKIYLRKNLEQCISSEMLDEAVEKMTKHSEGSFLYLHYTFKDLKCQHYSFHNIEDLLKTFPAGLTGVYEEFFGKRFLKQLQIDLGKIPGKDRYKNFLSMVVAAPTPLPTDVIQKALFGEKSDFEAEECLDDLLSRVTMVLPIRDGCVHVFHKSVCDWLFNEFDPDLRVDSQKGHMLLANLCNDAAEPIYANVIQSCDDLKSFLEKLGLNIYFLQIEAQQMSLGDLADAVQNGVIDQMTLRDEFGIIPYGDRSRIINALKTYEPNALPNASKFVNQQIAVMDYAMRHLVTHLCGCKRQKDARDKYLLSFEWLSAKVTEIGLSHAMADYETYLECNLQDHTMRLLKDAICLSLNALQHDPRELASQLVGRLMIFAEQSVEINDILQQAYSYWKKKDSIVWFPVPLTDASNTVMSLASLASPGDACIATLPHEMAKQKQASAANSKDGSSSRSSGYRRKIFGTSSTNLFVAHNTKGKPTIYSSCGKSLRKWSLEDIRFGFAEHSKCTGILSHDRTSITCIASSSDGTYICSGCKDGSVRLWWGFGQGDAHEKFNTWKPPDKRHRTDNNNQTGHTTRNEVTAVVFSPDDSLICSGCWDKSVIIWKGPNNPLHILHHDCAVHSVAFSPDGKYVCSGTTSSGIHFWDATSGIRLFNNIRRPDTVKAIAIAPDSQTICIAEGTNIKTFHRHGGKGITFATDKTMSNSISFSPCGARVCSGGKDGHVRLWDPVSGDCLALFLGHSKSVTSVVFSGDGRYIFSSSKDGSLRIWDSTSVKACKTLDKQVKIKKVAVSSKGTYVATLNTLKGDKSISVWHLNDSGEEIWNGMTAKLVYSFEEVRKSVRGLAFAADDEQILIATRRNNEGEGWKAVEGWHMDTGMKIIDHIPVRNTMRIDCPKIPYNSKDNINDVGFSIDSNISKDKKIELYAREDSIIGITVEDGKLSILRMNGCFAVNDTLDGFVRRRNDDDVDKHIINFMKRSQTGPIVDAFLRSSTRRVSLSRVSRVSTRIVYIEPETIPLSQYVLPSERARERLEFTKKYLHLGAKKIPELGKFQRFQNLYDSDYWNAYFLQEKKSRSGKNRHFEWGDQHIEAAGSPASNPIFEPSQPPHAARLQHEHGANPEPHARGEGGK